MPQCGLSRRVGTHGNAAHFEQSFTQNDDWPHGHQAIGLAGSIRATPKRQIHAAAY